MKPLAPAPVLSSLLLCACGRFRERTYVVDGGHDFNAWNCVWTGFPDSARPCEDIQ